MFYGVIYLKSNILLSASPMWEFVALLYIFEFWTDAQLRDNWKCHLDSESLWCALFTLCNPVVLNQGSRDPKRSLTEFQVVIFTIEFTLKLKSVWLRDSVTILMISFTFSTVIPWTVASPRMSHFRGPSHEKHWESLV